MRVAGLSARQRSIIQSVNRLVKMQSSNQIDRAKTKLNLEH